MLNKYDKTLIKFENISKKILEKFKILMNLVHYCCF